MQYRIACLPKSETYRRVLIAIFVLGLLAWPAAAEQEQPRTVVKSTKFVNVKELMPILALLDVRVALKPDANAIVLRGQEGGDLDTALRLIDTLDQPSPSVEVSVYILSASKSAPQAAPESDVGPELNAAVEHLKSLFGYQSIRLLDSVFLRAVEGRGGRVIGGVKDSGYTFRFDQVRITPVEDGDTFIHFSGLEFVLAGTDPDGKVRKANLRTDVQVRQGQKAVVGKSTPQGADETLILIIDASAVSPVS